MHRPQGWYRSSGSRKICFLAGNQRKIPRLSNLYPNRKIEWMITLHVTLSNGQIIYHILWWFPTKFTSCSAVAVTVSHRPLTAETQVLFQAVPCAGVCVCVCVWVCVCVYVCVWTRWHWDRFFSYWGFPCYCNSTNSPYYISLIYHWRSVT
jgi:hypothetical protein